MVGSQRHLLSLYKRGIYPRELMHSVRESVERCRTGAFIRMSVSIRLYLTELVSDSNKLRGKVVLWL